MAEVVLENLTLRYPGATEVAVKGIDLTIPDKKYLVLLGPSGCGKTSTLRMIAGLERPTAGQVIIDGQVVNDLYAGDRDIAMVFQSYALYPHKTVRDNLASCLKKRTSDKKEIDDRIRSVADKFSIKDVLPSYPREISIGQQQRVALARALIRRPKVFLLDEPLSNLDTTLKSEMRTFFKQLHQEVQITSVHVTHDQVEAQGLGDIVVIMDEGIIRQVGSPQDVYNNPSDLFVAGFMGSPAMNFIEGTIRGDGDFFFDFSSGTLPLPGYLAEKANRIPERKGRRIVLGVRPEHFLVFNKEVGHSFSLPLLVLEYRGNEVVMNFKLAERIVRIKKDRDQLGFVPQSGDTLYLKLPENYTYLFDLQTEKRIALE